MSPTRSLSLALCAVAVMATGCRNRENASKDVATAEQRNEILRLSAALEKEQEENKRLQDRLSDAQGQLGKQKEMGDSTARQLQDILGGGGVPGTYPVEGGGIALDEDFAFAKGSADISDEGKKTLGILAQKLNSGDYAKAKIIVEGHTDDTPVSRPGTKEKYHDNWGLSAARAATVVRELQAAGIPASRLYGAFRGEHQPRSTSKDSKDKAANRRVELHLK